MAQNLDVDKLVTQLFREQSGRLTPVLISIFGTDRIDLIEDIVQDAFYRALCRWPHDGVPKDPVNWLIRVARNRAIDLTRKQQQASYKQQEIEQAIGQRLNADQEGETFFDDELEDDQLRLIFACCDPHVTRESSVAGTLHWIGGFSADEIANAFLQKPATIAQRLVRIKRSFRQGRVAFEIPEPGQLKRRLPIVLEVLYAMFNEAYSTSSGDKLVRPEICREALRLCELIAKKESIATPEVHALSALLNFQAARLPARLIADVPVLLGDQDRESWDKARIQQAHFHLEHAAEGKSLSAFHLEAQIASLHTMAPTFEDTDWHLIAKTYDTLYKLRSTPVVALNRAVAYAQKDGAQVGLDLLNETVEEEDLKLYYPYHVTLSKLFRELGDRENAVMALENALKCPSSQPMKNHIKQQIQELTNGTPA